jgi:hypothetical protein
VFDRSDYDWYDENDARYGHHDPFWSHWRSGHCAACAAGTRLITREDNHNAMHWMEEGTCVPICEESEYLDPWDYTCRRSSDPGEHCEGEWDSFVCSSGLCGQSACCDASAAQKDADGRCCTVCAESDGACLARGWCPWWMQQYDAYGNFANEITVDPIFDDGYPGVAGCEATCEGWDVDEASCDEMPGCVWEYDGWEMESLGLEMSGASGGGRCWSAVGPEPCPEDAELAAELAARLAEEAAAAAAEAEAEAKAAEAFAEERAAIVEEIERKLEENKEALLEDITDEDARKKCELLVNALEAGKLAPQINANVTAADGAAACRRCLNAAGFDEDACVCEHEDIGRRRRSLRRRALLASEYEVTITVDPTGVDPNEMPTALDSLRAEVGSDAVSSAEIEPVKKLREVPGVNIATINAVETNVMSLMEAKVEAEAAREEAEAAREEADSLTTAAERAQSTAAAATEKATPPPPPPPRQLVFEDAAPPMEKAARVAIAAAAVALVALAGL